MAKAKASYVGENKNWQADSDLRVLKDAHSIHGDKGRHKAAVGAAKKEIGILRNIADKKRGFPLPFKKSLKGNEGV
jgi:hypothetical protein